MRTTIIATVASILVFALHTTVGAAPTAQFQCNVLENGIKASGTVSLRQGATEVVTGSCGVPMAAPPGSYTAVISLDGALDKPELQRSVEVKPTGTESVTVDFATAVLELRVEFEGRRAAGLGTIFKNGKSIGTLGSGVAAHISTGTYDVVVRYRDKQQRFDAVSLAPREHRTLSASF